MGTQGTGRKRSSKKERSTAEDDALNLIAREVSSPSLGGTDAHGACGRRRIATCPLPAASLLSPFLPR